jgi:hypothetical protein
MLQKRIPKWRVDGILELYETYKRSQAARVTDTVRRVAKKEPVAFSQFARDFAPAFAAAAPKPSAFAAAAI